MSSHSSRILLVEDDIVDSRDIEHMFEISGLPHDLRTAHSAEEARAHLERTQYDLVLLDQKLGDGTGLELLDAVGQTPVVFVAGSGDERIVVEAMHRGAADYIVKDTDRRYLTVLPATIEMVLARCSEADRLRTAEREREKLQLQRDRILESVQGAVCGIDQCGRIAFANANTFELTQRKRADLLGHKVAEALPFAGENDAFLIGRAVDDACELQLETLLLQGIEQPLPVELSIVPIREPDSGLTAVLSMRDIRRRQREAAERSRFEERKRQLYKFESLGRLAGGMAREFSKLLASVFGNSEIALRMLATDRHGKEILAEIRDSALEAVDLANQFMTYTGDGNFLLEPVDLGQLVEHSMRLLDLTVGTNAALEYDLSSDAVVADADRSQVGQLLLNLVRNAAEACGGQGQIRVRTHAVDLSADIDTTNWIGKPPVAGRYACLSVHDNGTGMSSEVQEHMLDPFFSTKPDGRGIGMSIAHGAVVAHDGLIRVESVEGEGTRIDILLPLSSCLARD